MIGRSTIVALAVIAASPQADAAVTISSAATQNMNCSGGICAPTAAKAVLNAGDLENMLASGSTTVTTTGSGVQAKDINVRAAVSWSSGSALILDAYQSVTIDQAISIQGLAALVLTTNDRGKHGKLSYGNKGHVTFDNLSSNLVINGAGYALANSVKSLASAIAANPYGTFALSKSYDASQDGTYSVSPIYIFYGVVDGLGNEISHLSVKDTQPEDNVGLIDAVESGGSVRNISLLYARVYGVSCYCGILAGYNGGRMYSVSVSGTMNGGGEGSTGAIVGFNAGTIQNSHTSATVNGGDISNVGGLVGENDGTLEKSFATGSVKLHGTERSDSYVGDLVGSNRGTIDQSFATGTLQMLYQSYSGGLVGANSGMIANSYATGNNSIMYMNDLYSGGLIGSNFGQVTNSYSTGTVAGATYIGGLIGGDFSTSGSITDTYWDTTTSGITNLSQGAGNIPNDRGITGLTTGQFQSGLPAGFDPKIWAENPNINNGLPYLIDNPPHS